jgi:hypothetical protein
MSCPVATILVHRAVGASPGYRDSAELLFADIDEAACEVVLDFSDVLFISRGFADQLHRAKLRFQNDRDLQVSIEHANEEIRAILNAVAKTQEDQVRQRASAQLVRVSGIQGLEDVLLGM